MPVREPQSAVSIDRVPGADITAGAMAAVMVYNSGTGHFLPATSAGVFTLAGFVDDAGSGGRTRVEVPPSSDARSLLRFGQRVTF